MFNLLSTIYAPQNANQSYLPALYKWPGFQLEQKSKQWEKSRTQKLLNETWEKYRRLQIINEQNLRGNDNSIILKWKHGLIASRDCNENHFVSYDCTRSHQIYQETTSIDFVHSNIWSAMNNVKHSRVNNRNIYLPRARVSGSWPAILDAFLASRSRDNQKHKKKISFSLSRSPRALRLPLPCFPFIDHFNHKHPKHPGKEI